MTTDLRRDWSMLNDELERYRRELDAIEADARAMLDGLTDAQLAWQPGPNAWSIGDCLDHLIVTGRHSLSHITDAADAARARGLLSPGPFRYSLFERWSVWTMEPPVRIRIPAPRAYRPPSRRQGAVVAAEFFLLQHELRQLLQLVNGLDLARVRVSNPVSRWITFTLGTELAFTAAHERRHLWQAQRIKAQPAFPGISVRS